MSATDTSVLPVVAEPTRFRPGPIGRSARVAAWVLLTYAVLVVPARSADVTAMSTLVILAIAALSLNVLLGYAGQISLGHQAFVGIGAFTSAYIVVDLDLSFWFAVPTAAVLGAVQAALLGAVSLRLSGLYFALVTLAYGGFAESTLFKISALTGGDAGKAVPRPPGFESDARYYYLCIGFLALVLYLDWRLTRSKGGRAMAALRENPRVSATYGIDVRAYIMLSFLVSGAFAGIAGALLAHNSTVITPEQFGFRFALVVIMMTVVGGLRNRAGIVVGAVVFGLLMSGRLLEMLRVDGLLQEHLNLPPEFAGLVFGPILLVIVLTKVPGGIGQLTTPIGIWMRGGRFDLRDGLVHEVEVSDVRA